MALPWNGRRRRMGRNERATALPWKGRRRRMGEMSGQWHCHGREEAGDWEKWAGNGIALERKKKE